MASIAPATAPERRATPAPGRPTFAGVLPESLALLECDLN